MIVQLLFLDHVDRDLLEGASEPEIDSVVPTPDVEPIHTLDRDAMGSDVVTDDELLAIRVQPRGGDPPDQVDQWRIHARRCEKRRWLRTELNERPGRASQEEAGRAHAKLDRRPDIDNARSPRRLGTAEMPHRIYPAQLPNAAATA